MGNAKITALHGLFFDFVKLNNLDLISICVNFFSRFPVVKLNHAHTHTRATLNLTFTYTILDNIQDRYSKTEHYSIIVSRGVPRYCSSPAAAALCGEVKAW